jgi:type IV fimbrial biogenesis protein FimT
MMVVLAISTVLLRIALPSYDSLVNDGRLAALSNELTGAVHLARSEAVKRAEDVTLCAANVGLSDCANSQTWQNGWVVLASNGEVLLRREALDSIFSMRDASPAVPLGRITFTSMGFTAIDRAIQICGPNSDPRIAKAVRITRPGEVRLAGDANGNGVLEPLRGGNDLVCS